MDKVVRGGQVAVLYAPGFGAGWYSWHSKEELLFDPAIVAMVERHAPVEEITSYVESKYAGEYVCVLGADDLTIEWVEQGHRFEITEYDGAESVRVFGPDDGLVA